MPPWGVRVPSLMHRPRVPELCGMCRPGYSRPYRRVRKIWLGMTSLTVGSRWDGRIRQSVACS
jgi:hypothetical protein